MKVVKDAFDAYSALSPGNCNFHKECLTLAAYLLSYTERESLLKADNVND